MKGQVLLHHVGKYLDLLEPQYFGLSFVGETAKPRSSRWLHPDKTLGRQLKSNTFFKPTDSKTTIPVVRGALFL